ncbi:MAG: Fe-S cluster assembly protein SufD [Ignavibacteria bacterium]
MAFTKDWYIENFRKIENKLTGGANTKLQKIRSEAIETFGLLDFPSVKNEEWIYTNISPILKYGFTPYDANGNFKLTDKISEYSVKGMDEITIVLYNGIFQNNIPVKHSLPAGVILSSFKNAIENNPDILEKHFGKYVKQENGFISLNTAFADDGVFIYIPDNVVLLKPIHIININGGRKEILSQPRNIIISGKNSSATVIESYNSLDNETGFTNVITELFAGEGSNINFYKFQNENDKSFHISRVQAEQKKSSVFTIYTVTTGGSLVRNDVNTLLNDEGCETHLFGLYLTDGSQHVDNHTLIDHAKPHCMSNELYKGVLNHKSHGVFNGKVYVRPDAQKTNAYQSNKNILLTKEASVDTKPQLEIYADDVRCTHGATVGQLDDESVFYFRSRGIPKDEAVKLLINAFANDIFENMENEPLREHIGKMIFNKLKF